MYHLSMEIINYTTEEYATWLDQVFLIVIIIQKWCYESETPAEVYRCKIHSALYNTSPQVLWYGKFSSIHELRTFLCDIYPITSSPKTFYDRK